ncbi:MAG: 30S ribosomal protein S7 [Thermoplasmata archaeon]|nr:30S ribosomal protein S7 [Thermoplasmata archaeon]
MADEVKTEEKKEEAVVEQPKEETPAPEVKKEEPAPVEEVKPEPKVEEKPVEAPKKETPAPEPAKEEAPAPAKDKSEPKAKAKPAEGSKSEPKKEATKDKKAEEPVAEAKPEATPEEKPAETTKPKGPKKSVGLPPEKVLLFGKYNLAEVVIHDPGLERYMNIEPIIVPHTGAKHANKWFGKTKLHIIERLLNNLMRTEEFTGKKTKGYKVLRDAFEIIEKRAKAHPVQVLVDALENSAPKEEITRLKYGGISVPKAVDTSASRRLDIAFRNISKGAVKASYKNSKPIAVCLANEIMLAAKKDMNSFAVSKKEELERVAASAR